MSVNDPSERGAEGQEPDFAGHWNKRNLRKPGQARGRAGFAVFGLARANALDRMHVQRKR